MRGIKEQTLLVFAVLSLLASQAGAQSVLFDFDAAPLHAPLPIELFEGGITASLSATGSNYSIQLANEIGFFPVGFAGNCLYPNGLALSDVLVGFFPPIQDISIMYAPSEEGCGSSATMRITGYMNSAFVATSTTTAPNPGTWPTGVLTLSAPQGFDSVVIHYDAGPAPPACNSAAIFVADNMTVTPLPIPPSLSIDDVAVVEGNAGTTTLGFTVSLSAVSDQTVTVGYATADGSATTADGDYVAASGTLSFAPGVTTQPVSVTVNGDVKNEANETLTVDLSAPTNAPISDSQGLGTIDNDDVVPALSINDVAITEGNSGTTTLGFTVSLSAVSGQTVTVGYATADGTATTADGDYLAASGTLSFAPGVTTQPVSVTVNGDVKNEANETLTVNLSVPTNATILDSQGLGTINNDDAVPALSIDDVAVAEGNAGTTTLGFTASLSAPSSQTVTVAYATADGTATTADGDYLAASGTLSFAPGVTTQPVSVTVNGDVKNEANETLTVNLSLPTNATILDSQGLGTINNDDAVPALSIDDVAVAEGNAGTTTLGFTASLSAPSSQTVTVAYATADGTATTADGDYLAASGTLSFAPGVTTQPVSVTVNGDVKNEANETLTVNLSLPTNATILDSQGLGTINNDDAVPALSIDDVAVAEGNAGTTTLGFTASLSAPSSQTVTVAYATADGTATTADGDYLAASGTLSFAPGVTTQPVSVTVNGDVKNEANETLTVNLSVPTNATISDSQGLGTITNDDAVPALSIDDVAVAEGNAGTTTLGFTASLSAPSSQTVTVAYATADGTATTADGDYLAASGTLSFAPGVTTQPVSVTVNGDVKNEANETLTVNLSLPTNATILDSQGLGTINNDDAVPALSIDDVAVAEGNAGTTTLGFTASLSAPSSQTVTVGYATADGTATTADGDYLAASGTLSFAPGVTTQPVSVTVNGDVKNEANETLTVNLSVPTNATILDSQGLGTINNDDAVPALSIDDVAVAEGNAGTTTLGFTASLSAASSQTVTVAYATADGTATTADGDYLAASGTLSFAPGVTTQPVSVTVNGDVKNEANETLTVNLSLPTNATILDSQGLGTINNDDAVPALSIDDVAVAEGNAGTTTLGFTASLSAPSSQTVTVAYATADGTATTADGDYLAASGTLSFAPGVTTQPVSVTVNGDVKNEANETLTVDLSVPTNATISDNQGLGTINNDDAVPALSIDDVAVAEGNAGTTTLGFTASLSAPSSQTVTVAYATADGTATTADGDYLAASGTLSFAPGVTTQPVSVTVNGDVKNEANETLTVNLSLPTNATILDSQGLGTINNDDAVPALSIDDVAVAEGNAGTTTLGFTASLSAPSSQTVTVAYATADGTATTADGDYLAASGTLSFAPGVTTQPVSVTVNGDVKNEANETLTVDLSVPTNATISDNQGLGTINNDDAVPALSIDDVAVAEGNAGTTTLGFTASLSAPSSQTVTVAYATADGTATTADGDYLAASGTLSFAPGVTTQPVSVTVNGDVKNEASETLTVNLSVPTNATILDSQGLGTINNDDAIPALSIDDVAVAEGNAGTTALGFTVSLSAASSQTVTVGYATADGSATTADGDYLAASGTLTFAPGVTTQPVSVTVNGDVKYEANDTLTINLSLPTNATISDSQGLGTITNDDVVPAFSIDDVAVAEGNAGTTALGFTVSLSAPSSQTVTVAYATADGTATTADGDYLAASGTLSFAPGVTTQPVSVTVNGDVKNEANETLTVDLSVPTNATISDNQGLGTINNDDAVPALSIDDVAVAEGNAGTTTLGFTASLSAPSSQTVTVAYATADGTATTADGDYLAASGTLSFAPGVTTQPVSVTVNGDVKNEANETLTVNLSLPTNATILDSQGLGTINNDDAVPALSIDDVAVAEGNAGTTTLGFTASLSAPSSQTVTVAYATADGTATTADGDYLAASGTLSFAPGVTTQPVSVTVNGDVKNEANETLTVDLSVPTNATISDNQGLGTINNDDAVPALSIDDVAVAEGNAGTTTLGFTASLSAPSSQTVTVAYATADGTATTADGDYLAASGTLSFAPGVTTQPVSVTVNGDVKNEASETLTVNLSVPTNATILDSQGLGTINNDDAIPALSIDDVAVAEGNAGTTALGFTVSLSAASSQTVTVGYATADGSATTADGDYLAASGTLTFAPGVTTQPVSVTVNGDVKYEANDTLTINLSLPTNATISDSQGLGTITNDDVVPAFSIDDVAVAEGNAGTTALGFTVSLSAPSSQTVTVGYTTADGTATTADGDYVAASGTLTFAPGVTTQPVSVTVNGDVKNEANETLTINLSARTNATVSDSQGLGTINNDDVVPALSIDDVAIDEGNSGVTTLAFTVSLSAVSGQTVTVGYAAANGTATTADGDYVAASGTLTFAPGVTTQPVSVTVTGDVKNEANETLTVNLSAPTSATISDGQGLGTITNDDAMPALAIDDVAIDEGNSGTTTLGFTVSLSAVSGQTVTVGYAAANGTATTDDADYVAASGTLSFAPGVTTQPVSVTVTGDVKNEANETLTVNLSVPTNASVSDSQGIGTINNDDAVPALSIDDVAIDEGNSGTTTLGFTVSLSAVSGQTVTVGYAAANGTATTDDADYVAASGTLSFAPGVTTQPVSVTVNEDVKNEANETLNVNLSAPTNATISDSQGLGTINNDDAAPTLSIDDIAIDEGNSGTSTLGFTVSLSAVSGQTVTVGYAAANGTATTADGDYLAVSGTLSFAPGVTTQPVSVTVNGDVKNEANETLTVNLSAPTNATISDNQGLGTITNDDVAPALSIDDVAIDEGNSGTTTLGFTVSLSAVSGQTVTVDYAAANGTATTADGDYLAASGTLSFAPGVTTQPVSVTVNGDVKNEGNETLIVNLSVATSATISDSQGFGTINNDDAVPALSIDDVAVAEGNSGTTTLGFTISLSAVSGQTVTVGYATTDGTATTADGDYVAASGTLSFAPGVTTQPVSVTVNGDGKNEGNETLTVNLSVPTSATISDSQGFGTINNDDAVPALSINDVAVAEGNSGTTTLGFTISLSAVSGQTVTVGYATTDGTATTADGDYVAASGTLSFAPGVTTQPVNVTVNGDVKNEANETLVVNLSGPVNATVSDGQGIGTITNDDLATYLLSVSTAGSGSGKVTSTPAGIDCGSDCSESYTAGTVVTLTAEPGPTSTFEGWSGGSCSGTSLTCQLTMDMARTATATFAAVPGAGYYTVSPCRVLDSRELLGPWSGLPLGAHQERTLTIVGACAIPATAKALSFNVTAVAATAGGFISVYPVGPPRPGASTLNFAAGQTRANNGIVSLGAAGDLAFYSGQGSGSVHLVLDVNGYFE